MFIWDLNPLQLPSLVKAKSADQACKIQKRDGIEEKEPRQIDEK